MNFSMFAPLVQQLLSGNANEKEQLVAVALPAIMTLIQSHPGGLAGIVQQLENSGLGPQIRSWVGSGQNLPVTPAQIQQGLTAEQITQIAQQTGAQHPQIASLIAMYLPQIVDHLTPNGTVPHDTAVTQNLTALKDLLGGVEAAEPQAQAATA